MKKKTLSGEVWERLIDRHRIVIVAAGDIAACDWNGVKQENDVIITVDGGTWSALDYGWRPDLVVGDFDSAGERLLNYVTAEEIAYLKLPTEKDLTDTHYALEVSVNLRPREVLLLGALGGGRLDHALANVYLLEWLAHTGVKGRLIHRTNQVRLLTGAEELTVRKEHSYLSLLPLTAKVTGVTLTGVRYPLTQATLQRGQSLAISNEVVDQMGIIRISSGKLLVIESSDN
ncbi:thiamine diphosphokinase [Mechercharimyces sp. CAU 1602]|uniref:thiamine diphosphokinase n=1 Tax=Mechercharimyces sp. CAU 1602 TaxID=2973933 RepID=UPI0021617109|nr:thiamine diphosphokinase [Mechercharimyces sp. CAU 1602]MCS1351385.1 thiamine diphosphokinase [Mechercharimyces sp. CAU 1602]